jgi:hypothetical protein
MLNGFEWQTKLVNDNVHFEAFEVSPAGEAHLASMRVSLICPISLA